MSSEKRGTKTARLRRAGIDGEVVTIHEATLRAIASMKAKEPDFAGVIEECMAKSESPLERSFWLYSHRFAGPFVSIQSQKKIGCFRLDAFFETETARIGIELDGAAYHDQNEDYRRDREILRSGLVDEIIRIPFAAITYYPNATCCVLAAWHNEFEVPREFSCLRLDEATEEVSEMEKAGVGLRDECIEWVDKNFEVYSDECDMFNYACSYKTAINRANPGSKLRLISRMQKDLNDIREIEETDEGRDPWEQFQSF